MTMLEDDLRELFSAHVHNSPAPSDPAGAAIRRARRMAARRRATIGAIATVIFAALLGGMASIKGIWGVPGTREDHLTFEAIYGSGHEPPQRAGEALPIIAMPVDVHVGTALWTTDGRRLTLAGVDAVIDVTRVPSGWLYSDDFRLRLLTVSGQLVSLRNNVSAWTVSGDGTKIATVFEGTNLEVGPVGGPDGTETAVPAGTRAVGFDSGRVVLARDGSGSDHWNGATATYKETWHERLLAVYGGLGDDAVGLLAEDGTTCLVDVRAESSGWRTGAKLGCGDLLTTAARAGYGQSRAARSPDGRWLAVPSPTGVHVIDIDASRSAVAGGAGTTGGPVVAQTCASTPDAPAVWSDAKTVLTIGTGNGVIACGIDGTRHAVQLPSGVTDGWALVRRFGVTG